jgi:hypothetical protein
MKPGRGNDEFKNTAKTSFNGYLSLTQFCIRHGKKRNPGAQSRLALMGLTVTRNGSTYILESAPWPFDAKKSSLPAWKRYAIEQGVAA